MKTIVPAAKDNVMDIQNSSTKALTHPDSELSEISNYVKFKDREIKEGTNTLETA